MADSLREAAACVHNAWLDGRSLDDGMLQIRIALSEPDPVAEAREIIQGLCDMGALCWGEPRDECKCFSCCLHRAKEWLERNGGGK